MEHLSVENFDGITKTGTVLVDFFATWCGPCKMLAPVLEEVAKELAGKVTICKVDVDEQGALAEKFMITAVPTLLLFKNEKVAWQYSGYLNKDELLQQLAKEL